MRAGWARGMATVSALLAATSCGGGSRAVVGSNSSGPSALGCTLPALPAPGTGNPTLGGPAVATMQGGAVRAAFELDSGQLRVTPPVPGDTPAVSANQAECAALAALNANGLPLLQYAKLFGGAVAGYGRVSVAQDLVATAPTPGYLQGTDNERSRASLPGAAAYKQRLAWLVVVKNGGFTGGCGPLPSTTTEPAPPSNDYIVFLLDAHLGTDALLYIESPGPCDTGQLPPTVAVPTELVSVPWTLESRPPTTLPLGSAPRFCAATDTPTRCRSTGPVQPSTSWSNARSTPPAGPPNQSPWNCGLTTPVPRCPPESPTTRSAPTSHSLPPERTRRPRPRSAVTGPPLPRRACCHRSQHRGSDGVVGTWS